LVFVCDNNSGGIGNIRNFILTCLRYAIDAGAGGLVMPQIRTRSVDNLADLMRDYRDFDYFFDEKHFRTSLQTHCPQITIYDKIWDVPNTKAPFQAEQITPRDLGSRASCDNRDLNRHTDIFGHRFDAWLQDKATQFNLPSISIAHPRLIRLNWGVQWDFPVYRDGPEFVATFGGLLRFREDILELGRQVAAKMRVIAGGDSSDSRFIGLHLRTENDALAGWPSFDNQTAVYLRAASDRHFTAGYLATGNETEAAKFGKEAAQQMLRIVTKQDLVRDDEHLAKQLMSLSWDQQALIDFLVLLDSDYFVGVNPSSFSMNVALKRHLQAEGLYTRPWKVGGNGDERSWIVGKFEKYWEDWLFMYDSLWP
jgi:hypothetical protein